LNVWSFVSFIRIYYTIYCNIASRISKVSRISRFSFLKNYNADKWFYDTGKNKKPYIGRVLGYFMIKKYLEQNKSLKVVDLLKLSPNELTKVIYKSNT